MQAGRFLGPLLALSWSLSLALRSERSRRFWQRLFAARYRRGIASDMPDQVVLHRPGDRCVVQTTGHGAVGEFGKARENVASLGRALLKPHRR